VKLFEPLFSIQLIDYAVGCERCSLIPYPRVLHLYGESGCADVSIERMWTFSRRFTSYKPSRKPTLTIPPTCTQRERVMRRGVKLFMIISDSTINKPIFHFVTYSSAKRFGCLLYMCTFKIRAKENSFWNSRQIASDVFYFLRYGILIELLTRKIQIPLKCSFNLFCLDIQYKYS